MRGVAVGTGRPDDRNRLLRRSTRLLGRPGRAGKLLAGELLAGKLLAGKLLLRRGNRLLPRHRLVRHGLLLTPRGQAADVLDEPTTGQPHRRSTTRARAAEHLVQRLPQPVHLGAQRLDLRTRPRRLLLLLLPGLQGVIVVVEAEHLCMGMRGVRKAGSTTTTSAVRGVFRSSASSRSEALALIRDK